MASVASQLIEEVTAHAQSESLEDAREMCADGTYFPNNLRCYVVIPIYSVVYSFHDSSYKRQVLGAFAKITKKETLLAS